MAKPLINLFFCMLVGILLLTSCAQPGTVNPPSPTAVSIPTAVPEAVAIELGSIGKGTPVGAAWSPDGSRLAISSTRGIIIYTQPDWEVENFIDLSSQVSEEVDLEFLVDGNSLLFRGDQSKKILYEINLLNNEIIELSIRSHSSSRSRLIVSPDGKTIASYEIQRAYSKSEEIPSSLEILDKASGTVIHSYTSPINRLSAIHTAVFSPDSKLLAAGGDDNHVRIYDVNNGDIRLDGSHYSDIKSVAFSLDGKILVSAGDDATIQFWDVETGKNIHTMKDFTETISFAGYCSHGEEFIIRFRNGSYQKWALDEKKLPLHQLDFDLSPKANGYTRISPDGESLVSIQKEEVKIWDLKTGREKTTLPEYTGTLGDLEFNADGKFLAAVDSSSNIVIWETDTGKYSTLLEMKVMYISDISFHPVNNLLAVARRDGQVQVWDFFLHEVVARYQTEDDCSFRSIQYSPDGSLLAASADTCGIFIWDTSTGKLRMRLESEQTGSSSTSIWFDLKRDEVFATTANENKVSRWNLTSGKHIHDVKLSENSSVPYIDPMHNRVYECVYSGSSTMLAAWDAVSGEKQFETGLENCSHTQAVDPTGTLLATYQINTITFYSLGSMQALTSVDFVDNPSEMVFSSDKRYMAVQSSANSFINIFNIESLYDRAALIKNMTPPAPAPTPTTTPTTAPTVLPGEIADLIPVDLPVTLPGAITKDRVNEVTDLGTFGFGFLNKAVWSPNSQYFSLIGKRSIFLYRTGGSGQPEQIFVTNKSPSAVVFSPNNKYLAVNTSEKLTLWEVQTGQALHEWTGYLSSYLFNQISFSPDNQYLLVRKTEYKENQTSRNDIILDTQTGEVVETKAIPADKGDLTGFTLSPDGLFAITSLNQAIRIIDPSTRSIRYTFERPENDYGIIRNWAISPQGKLMVRYFQPGSPDPISIIEMWDVSIDTPPSLLWAGEAGPIYLEEGQAFGSPNYAFSPDGKLLAVSDKDNLVHIWDAASGKLLIQIERGSMISFSPDGASLLLIDNRGFISVWNINPDFTFSLKAEIEGFGSSSMYSSDFFSGDKLVTISNQKISTWDVANAKKVNVPITTQYLKSIKPGLIALSSGNILATTQESEKISLFNTTTGALIKNLSRGDDKNNSRNNVIAISHDEKTVVSANLTSLVGKSFEVWDVASGNIRKEIPYPSYNIRNFIFSPDDRLIIGLSSNSSKLKGSELVIWDAVTGELLRYYSNLGNKISLHPNGVFLVSIQIDGMLSFLDLNYGNILWQGQSNENVRDIAFSPDGQILVVLTPKTVEFWDTAAHQKLSEFSMDAQNIIFSSDGKYIAIGYEDDTYQILGLKN